jgi:hypothetical protein
MIWYCYPIISLILHTKQTLRVCNPTLNSLLLYTSIKLSGTLIPLLNEFESHSKISKQLLDIVTHQNKFRIRCDVFYNLSTMKDFIESSMNWDLDSLHLKSIHSRTFSFFLRIILSLKSTILSSFSFLSFLY